MNIRNFHAHANMQLYICYACIKNKQKKREEKAKASYSG